MDGRVCVFASGSARGGPSLDRAQPLLMEADDLFVQMRARQQADGRAGSFSQELYIDGEMLTRKFHF